MKHLGITGTRKGMTKRQKDILAHTLALCKTKGFSVFHDGDCVGVDVEACEMAIAHGYDTVGHPSTAKTRAGFDGRRRNYEPKDPLMRNRDIVNESALLIACPGQNTEVLRSGTWACVRYAKKVGCRIIFIMPDGAIVTWRRDDA